MMCSACRRRSASISSGRTTPTSCRASSPVRCSSATTCSPSPVAAGACGTSNALGARPARRYRREGPTPPPSPRATVRYKGRGHYDPGVVDAILDEAVACHVGVVQDDGSPMVLPTLFVRDGDNLYV